MWETRDSSRGSTGKSDLPSCCEGKLGVPFESLQGNQALSRVEGELGFLLACSGKHMVPLEWQWGTGDTSQVATGESGLLLSWGGEVVFPLELQQGSQTSSGVVAETWVSSLVIAKNLAFPWQLPQGPESSSQSARRNQCPSVFSSWDVGLHWSRGGKVWVHLKLGWYSGFLATCDGASCWVLLGWLISSRDGQGGFCLVAGGGENTGKCPFGHFSVPTAPPAHGTTWRMEQTTQVGSGTPRGHFAFSSRSPERLLEGHRLSVCPGIWARCCRCS